MFKVKVVADSVGPNGVRLSSVEMTYPRFIHAEIMTHRDRARNAASSRAIPWKRKRSANPNETLQEYRENVTESEELGAFSEKCMYWQIMADPVVPIAFGKEQKGMQTGDNLSGPELMEAERVWLEARDHAVRAADMLANLGVHKSICNRLTEPFMWITVLMSATEWKNFFRLRVHPDAEVHFQKIANMTRDALNGSTPQVLRAGQWHLPYFSYQDGVDLHEQLEQRFLQSVDEKDYFTYVQNKELLGKQLIFDKYSKLISAGRSARLSYLTQDGKRSFDEDVNLCKRLIDRKDNVLHASPLEHVACASSRLDLQSGCFRGWHQFRKEFANENVEGHLEADSPQPSV